MEISFVGTRHDCAKTIRLMSREKHAGLVSNVILKRISLRTWYISFRVEVTND